MNQQTVWFTIMIVIVGSLVLVSGIPSGKQGGDALIPENIAQNPEDSLQINTFKFITPSAPSTVYCPKHIQIDLNTCKCSEFAACHFSDGTGCKLGQPYCDAFYCGSDPFNCDPNYICDPKRAELCPPNPCTTQCNADYAAGKCTGICYAKPVIYLYPQKPTRVDVELKIPGVVTVSDPVYPETGWKNVLAHPDGNLLYNNSIYPYLYYETDVDSPNMPESGIILAREELREKLTHITSQLGLVEREQRDFLLYWIPELEQLNSPYILFQLLDPAEKERADHISVHPEPDTRIEFLVHFTPLQNKKFIKPLLLPNAPVRKGFTLVEWGGAIIR